MGRRPGTICAGVIAALLTIACDPINGTGSGTPPDPHRFLKADPATRSVVLTLVGGYPATDYQFNYDGYGYGTLQIAVPAGWAVTVQCQNHASVPVSCAVVADAAATAPVDPAWSTPDPVHGLSPGTSASFSFTPTTPGTYRIASLVAGDEAGGMFATLKVTPAGAPSITAPPH